VRDKLVRRMRRNRGGRNKEIRQMVFGGPAGTRVISGRRRTQHVPSPKDIGVFSIFLRDQNMDCTCNHY
jgi:hypothetical protein